jgi:DNA modification methylase
MVTHQKVKHIKHPSPKDPDMTKWIIENATNPGDTILDPFMGSGTTGVACVQTGRNFIGIEIEPKYFEIAEKRIAEAQMQMRMPI